MSLVCFKRMLSVTTPSRAAATALNAFENEVLSYGNGANIVFDAPLHDPDWALAHAYSAVLHMFRSNRPGIDEARILLNRAKVLNSGNSRERLMIKALINWANGNAMKAIVHLGDLIETYPQDLFAVRLRQHLQFSQGDAVGMLKTIDSVFHVHCNDARAWSMRAFALDQCGQHAAAEVSARRSLEIAPDPWAHHSMAHAFHATARFVEGRAWMQQHCADWSACTSFLFTHNWWHAALFELALGNYDEALDLFDRCVWGVRKDNAQDQINAISLLARLELVGAAVGNRWVDIASYVSPRRTDAVDPFLDLHYAYALARAGDHDGVSDLIECLNQSEFDNIRSNVVANAAQGLVAFAFNQRAQAARLLGAERNSFYLLGGSTVQRDLFDTLLSLANDRPNDEIKRIAA